MNQQRQDRNLKQAHVINLVEMTKFLTNTTIFQIYSKKKLSDSILYSNILYYLFYIIQIPKITVDHIFMFLAKISPEF